MRRQPLLGIVMIIGAVGPAQAQEPDAQAPPVRAVVDQVAGATLYLTVGRDGGILTGDTVWVARDSVGERLGVLVVLRSTATRSVLTFAEEPFAITRGQVLFVTPRGTASAREPGADDPAAGARVEERLRAAPARRPDVGGPVTRGSLSLDVAVRQSSTRFGGGDGQVIDRTFATPSLRLNTTVTQPLDWTLRLRTQVSHRYASTGTQINPTSVRVYEASFEKTLRSVPLRFQLGRFYNRYESYSGYWDGLLIRAGGRKAGFGVLLGLEPERSNQTVSADLPKATAFANFRSDGRRTRYAADVSVHRVDPRNGLLTHTYAGLSQRLRVGRVRVDQELQIDEDPVAGGWEATRFQLNVRGDVDRRVELRAGVSRQRPYRLFDPVSAISHPRDQLNGGLRVRAGRAIVSGDVAVNRDRDREDLGYSYSTYLFVPGSGSLGVTAAASYRTGSEYEAVTLSPGLTGTFGRMRANLSYRFYRSEYGPDRLFTTHTVQAGLDVPAGLGFRYRLRGSGQWGSGLTSGRLHAGLTKSF
ncbi:MAG: hypothetical protein ABFS34_02675 [Gemmatimonadota bacterium]